MSADVLTPGDYNGDGRTDYAVFRPGNATWYVATEVGTSFSAVQFGETADVPAAGDYDGDGKTDIAVFRHAGGMWFIRRQDGSVYGVQFGTAGDIPAPGDYDGDGKTDIAVFRPGPADWYILTDPTVKSNLSLAILVTVPCMQTTTMRAHDIASSVSGRATVHPNRSDVRRSSSLVSEW